uniref:TonB-dependent receptor n=1 Tax=Roseihalotalea indica TaxID=2867963 RepID=A0AA49GR72_9BACT|nr:TonB-dependent receptor [Tunicatimonas sp. TK19036]
MKNILSLLLLLYLIPLVSPSTVQAQSSLIKVSGKVKDQETGDPLIGVSVAVKNTVTGTITDTDGNFSFNTKVSFPFTLLISYVGYEPEEFLVKDLTSDIYVEMKTQTLLINEVVVTASRVEERISKSPVAVEKLDIRAIKETPSPNFFDAMESVKGVQMTTLSLGFKVPNTRGFANTTNARFLQMVDGADTQAPGLGVSIANTVGPTELDIESIEITPGASSALYGMNALNGISNLITKSPFLYQGLSLYQRTGVNHVDGIDHTPSLFSESAVRYAKAFNNRVAFKINVGYLKGTDWVADSRRELNPEANASVGLLGSDNPASDPLNSYGNESANRRNLTLADGKRYEVRRTGYYEKYLVNNDYGVENLKFDAALHYKITENIEASYAYRIGTSDANYQRGNRIRLDNYLIQQHKAEVKGSNYLLRGYLVIENTEDSYNLRPMGENMDRAFKADDAWYADYQTAFNQQYDQGVPVAESHRQARDFADAGRFQQGTATFDNKLDELAHINNWDVGAQLLMEHQFYHVEGQYDFQDRIRWMDVLVGADYRDFLIKPEGNSFANPNGDDPLATLHNAKYGAFAQGTKTLLDEKLKLVASVRLDKNQYYEAKINPRFAGVYTFKQIHNFRASYQNGYRFPTLFEGFSTVNNGGVIRFGGIDIMSRNLRLFENSYLRSSVDAFQAAVTGDINNAGKTREQAILDNQGLLARNTYTYLVPEEINAFDLGYKASLWNNRVFIDADFYYNVYNNFIDQIEIAVPNEGAIGELVNGVDPTIFEVEDRTRHTRYRMWTNSKSTYYNYGSSLGVFYNFYKKYSLSTNVSYAKLDKIDGKDSGLETPFNTPEYIVNVTFGNRELFKNVGFNMAWRWQDAFVWRAPLADGLVPAYHTFDAQVTAKIPSLLATAKLGGSNIFNQRYYQYEGGPTIGAMYYLALTFDGLLMK